MLYRKVVKYGSFSSYLSASPFPTAKSTSIALPLGIRNNGNRKFKKLYTRLERERYLSPVISDECTQLIPSSVVARLPGNGQAGSNQSRNQACTNTFFKLWPRFEVFIGTWYWCCSRIYWNTGFKNWRNFNRVERLYVWSPGHSLQPVKFLFVSPFQSSFRQ